MSEKIIQEVLSEIGETINGQITITYKTEQTLGQFLEIKAEEENYVFDKEEFLEYVLDNVAEYIKDTVRFNGDKALKREITLLNGDAEEV